MSGAWPEPGPRPTISSCPDARNQEILFNRYHSTGCYALKCKTRQGLSFEIKTKGNSEADA